MRRLRVRVSDGDYTTKDRIENKTSWTTYIYHLNMSTSSSNFFQFLILSFQNCLDDSNLKKLYMMRSAQEELLRQNNDLNEKSSFDS